MLTLALACGFLACARPLPTAPDEGPLLAQATGDITVTYECGNTFLFRNRSLDTLTLTWRVRGNQEVGTVFLPARPAAGEFSETRVATQVRGPLQVFKGRQPLATVPNEHGADCAVVPPTDTTPVPPAAPDSVPDWIRADSSIGLDGFTKGILLVVFKDGVTPEARTEFVRAAKASVVGGVPSPLGLEGFYFLRLNDPAALANPDSVVTALSSSPLLESVSRDFRGTVPSWRNPNDGAGWRSTDWDADPTRASGENWALEAMRLPLAWGCTTGDAHVKLGLIDHEFDRSEIEENTDDDHGAFGRSSGPAPHHGTMMGNLMAARGGDGAGMSGASQSAGLVLRDVGTYSPTPQQLVTAVEQMAHDGVKVVNISYSWRVPYVGATKPPVRTDPFAIAFVQRNLAPMIARFRVLRSKGKLPLLVISAGNDSYDAYFAGYPALRDEFPDHVLTVAAANRSLGGPWGALNSGPNSGANFGDHVDLYAPGELVYTHKDGSGVIGSTSGSSDATALVSGVLGLALAMDPDLTPQDLRALAVDTTRWHNVMIAHGHSVTGDAPVLDAYGFLRNVAARQRTALCGNQLWPVGNTLFASRGDPAQPDSEAVGTIAANIAGVFPYHGGQKVAVMDENWDWFALTRDDQGRWSSAPWDFDEVGVAGTGVSIYGNTHDRDSVAFVQSDRVYLGTRWLNTDRIVVDLQQKYQDFGSSGSEVCTMEVNLSEGWQCREWGWVGTSTYGDWSGDASPSGGQTIFIHYTVQRSVTRLEAPVDCYNGLPPNENTFCKRYRGTGESTTLRNEVWRIARDGSEQRKVLDLPGRQIGWITGGEDGVSFGITMSDPIADGFSRNCTIEFYQVPAFGATTRIGSVHKMADQCGRWDLNGGLSAVRGRMASTSPQPTSGFGLRSRLAASLRR